MHIFREEPTIEYETMYRAVEALFRRFPDIERDVTRAKQDAQPLISKLRKVCNE